MDFALAEGLLVVHEVLGIGFRVLRIRNGDMEATRRLGVEGLGCLVGSQGIDKKRAQLLCLRGA